MTQEAIDAALVLLEYGLSGKAMLLARVSPAVELLKKGKR